MKPFVCALFLLAAGATARAAELIVELGKDSDAVRVGAVQRWDADGNLRHPVDPKAAIDRPPVDAEAIDQGGGRWMFANLPPGKYDLIILTKDRRRIEGFQFAPVKDFDPFIPHSNTIDAETRQAISDDIARSPHYENKVEPLGFAGDRQAVRVLVALVRDKPTSYESELPGAATLRHEIWQYTWQYGGWRKEKRTKVLDRVILPRNQLLAWTWLWDARLGGIELRDEPVRVVYP